MRLSVFSNWNQAFSDLDRAFTVKRLSAEFEFSEEIILQDFFPALGGEPDKGLYSEYLDAAGLDSSLLDLIADGFLPFRGAKALSRFSAKDQREWVSILTRAALTSNQCWKAADWLFDLQKTKGESLKVVLSHHPDLTAVLDPPQTDRRAKADQFFKALWQIRFPRLAEREKKWAGLVREISAGSREIRIEAPAFFEDEGILLKAKLKNRGALDAALNLLGEKRNLLNSLFDVML